MLRTLKDKGVKMVAPQELQFMFESKDTARPLVIDIRPESEYEKGFISGAINVPFYQPIEGWTPFKIARRVGFALFGVAGTEPNPKFESQVLELAAAGTTSPTQPIVIYCLMGGSMDEVTAAAMPNIDNPESIQRVKKLQTRSMVAAFQLVEAGVTSVSILKGGYSSWASGGRDVSMLVDE